MIILTTNVGSLNEHSSKILSNRILKIDSLFNKKPDALLIQETCHTPELELLNFGYCNNYGSFENDKSIDQKKQRGVKTFSNTGKFPKDLNIFDEITVMVVQVLIKGNGLRMRKKLIGIVNMYRNFRISEDSFIDKLNWIEVGLSKLSVFGVIMCGDTNMEVMLLSNLTEILHNGFHKTNTKSRETSIDKVFVSPSLLNNDIKILIMDTCEKKTGELGHKTIVLYINEKLISKGKNIVSSKKFISNTKSAFDDKFSNIIIANLKSKYKDNEANRVINMLDTLTEESKIEIKLREPLVVEDLETLVIDKSSDGIKCFCLLYRRFGIKLLSNHFFKLFHC